MSLTTAQETTLAAHIRANQDAAVVAALAIRNDTELARLYNLAASPVFYVWKDSVTQDEVMTNGFDWTRVDNLTVGKARIWEWMFDNARKSIDPRKANVLSGIVETWRGTAADIAVRGVVLGHCYRLASVFERIFATGAGTLPSVVSDVVQGGGLAVIAGPVSVDDVSYALNRNPV